MPRPRRIVRNPGADYEIRVVGDFRTPLRDFYHALLHEPWWVTIVAISGAFLAANAIFAGLYLIVGGIAHAAPASFGDAFFFSVQTMGTIGYGTLYPESTAANVLVVAESITSLLLTALATGLVFAKFSRSTARLVFTREAAIAPMDGVPTLSFRVGNTRGNQIVDARIRVVMMRTEKTAEGKTFYRMVDLPLTRDSAISLQRSWAVFHVIDGRSALQGETPDSVIAKEIELQVQVLGLDDVTMQPVYASHQYYTRDILWGARHVDIIHETPEGHLEIDVRKFHDIEPTAPTERFPYSRA